MISIAVRFSGEIPAELGRLTALQDLQLCTNNLTGEWAFVGWTDSAGGTLSWLCGDGVLCDVLLLNGRAWCLTGKS